MPDQTRNLNSVTDFTGTLDSNDRIIMTDNKASLKALTTAILGKAMIEGYTGSSLAGSSQSVKSAIDGLNSKTDLVLRYTSGGIDGNTCADGCIVSSAVSGHSNLAKNDERCVVITYTLVSNVRKIQTQYTMTDIYRRTLGGSGWTSWERLPSREEVDELNSNAYLLNGATLVPSNSDLNTYTTAGNYQIKFTSDANTISNMPVKTAGVLKVEISGYASNNYKRQTFYEFNNSNRHIRYTNDNGNTWSTWEWQPSRAEVDALRNALAKDYGRIGDNKTYIESFEYLANQLPAGVPIMGTYNSSGAKVFWGYLYNERNYGMFEVINYTGNRATVVLNNGTWKTV